MNFKKSKTDKSLIDKKKQIDFTIKEDVLER